MKRVLVTGGTGFIGQHTLMPLLARGYDVHVVTSKPLAVFHNEMTLHAVNLLDCSTHQPLMMSIRPTHLLHAAWYTEHGQFWEAVENVPWLQATIALVESFYQAGGMRVLGLGTCAEYDWNEGLCIEDTTREMPVSFYGKIKKSTYECLSAVSQSQSKPFAWARLFFPYGAYESEKRLIPHVITRLLQNREALCTHGNQIRDFLHVADMGDALAALIDSDVNGVVNIGSGVPYTICEVVNRIARLLKKEALVRFGAIPEPAYSPPTILADTRKLTTKVAWSAQLSLDEGLSKTIAWWRVMRHLTTG